MLGVWKCWCLQPVGLFVTVFSAVLGLVLSRTAADKAHSGEALQPRFHESKATKASVKD